MSSEASKYFQHSFIRLCISIIYKNQQEGVEINKYSPTNEFSENSVQIRFQNKFFRKNKKFLYKRFIMFVTKLSCEKYVVSIKLCKAFRL